MTRSGSRTRSDASTPWAAFPPTRYQGSKRKLLPVLAELFGELAGQRVLDAFGGSGAVSYLLRALGRTVVYNDLLRANVVLARGLLDPGGAPLDADRLLSLLEPQPGRSYDDLIEREYAGIYYTDTENRALDRAAQNLPGLRDPLQHARAWFALAQACLIKRPYNLFHRANLSLRTADVRRSFGNKVTWERPLAELLPRFHAQVERAARALPAGPAVTVRQDDVLELPTSFDLVYLDPPYVPRRGAGVDYGAFYHFLEGLLDYERWSDRIDRQRRHRPYGLPASPWARRDSVGDLLRRTVERFSGATIVLSYRSDGVPGPEELQALLRRVKGSVQVVDVGAYQYALSTNRTSRELLFVGK